MTSKTPKSLPTIHLFIPQLFQNLPVWKQDFNFEAQSPYLSQLLRQFNVSSQDHVNCLSEAMFASIGLESNVEVPMAHYRHQVHNETTIDATSTLLICADPVHLEVGMNDVTLTQTIDDLNKDEANELIEILNQHFKEDGLSFVYGSNSQWYISLSAEKPETDAIKSHPLETVVRKNIAKSLLVSKNRNWQAIQNEIQMLLHSTDINQQRELQGLATLNSLWLWGAGSPLEELEQGRDVLRVIGGNSDEGIKGKSLAQALSCKWQMLGESIKWNEINSGKTMLIADQLLHPAIHDAPEDFQQALTQLENQIIQPLMALWQKNKIDLIIDGCDGYLFRPEKVASWKFWIKPLSLLNTIKTAQIDQKGGRCALNDINNADNNATPSKSA